MSIHKRLAASCLSRPSTKAEKLTTGGGWVGAQVVWTHEVSIFIEEGLIQESFWIDWKVCDICSPREV